MDVNAVSRPRVVDFAESLATASNWSGIHRPRTASTGTKPAHWDTTLIRNHLTSLPF